MKLRKLYIGRVTNPEPVEAQPRSRLPLVLLCALLLMRLAMLLLTDGISYAAARMGGDPSPLVNALISSNYWIVAVDIVTLIVVAKVLRREGARLGSLFSPARVGRDLLLGLAAFVILTIALTVTTFVANLVVYQGPPPATQSTVVPSLLMGIWSVSIMPITIALAEEVLYRGYLQPRFQGRLGTAVGLLVVALGFGLQHLAFSLTSPQAALARVLATSGAGIVFGLLYLWFKRLLPLVIGHWLVDVLFLGLPLLLTASSSS